ncbi:MAG: AAA family ATPase [Flavobacteriaceae bacterium]|nr:AAA family ATPase [Flavobacteriaceae bacterium]
MKSILDTDKLYKLIKKEFPYTPTATQDIVLQKLAAFITEKEDSGIFLLKGFAGTGKTTIIGSIVANLWKSTVKSVLMAPTGRAAKVMTAYSNTTAFTIHKKIYFPKTNKGGGVQFVLSPNKHRNTLFIVDEASMISNTSSDSKLFENGSLLDDLIQYVYSGHQCKLILIGDTAQLPPVHAIVSPALDENQLALQYQREVEMIEMQEVLRQASDSGILYNATEIRSRIQDNFYEDFRFKLRGFLDIVRLVDGHDIQSAIDEAYSNVGKEETVIVVRSNKRANLFNQQIRSRILFHENELTAGDYLMVVRNNYFWVKPNSDAGFVANGDIIEVLEIFGFKDLYGFRFAEVKIKMVDYPNMQPFETVLLLDTLEAQSPSLSYEEANRLYQEVLQDYADEPTKYKKFLKVKSNKYFNALQVKFSYAITCHKSQGGQWDTVFIEQPYLPNGPDTDYMRWLYTALTRSKRKLYLLGFQNEYFEED